MKTARRPVGRNTGLIALLAFLSITALGGGGALILEPDGSLLGMSTGELATSLFPDFRWPGLILFVLFGLGSAVALVAVVRRWRIAGRLALAIGSAQLVWILVETVMIEDLSFLQPLLLLVGAGIAYFGARLNGHARPTAH